MLIADCCLIIQLEKFHNISLQKIDNQSLSLLKPAA